MELKPGVVKDHCAHRTDAETGCSSIWGVMWGEPWGPIGQENNWEQQARGILCQMKLKLVERRVLRGLNNSGCGSHLHADKEHETSWEKHCWARE